MWKIKQSEISNKNTATSLLITIKKLRVIIILISDYAQGNQNDKVYELPDGQTVTIGSQRIRCAEALFKPMLIGKYMPGFHEITYQSILKSEMDLRKDLYNNIVMSGGSTMFPGIPERLSK